MAAAPDSAESSVDIYNGDILTLSESHEEDAIIHILYAKNEAFKNCNQASLRKKLEEVKKKFKDLKNRKMTKKLTEFRGKLFCAPAGRNYTSTSMSSVPSMTVVSNVQANVAAQQEEVSKLKETLEVTKCALKEVYDQHSEALNTAFTEQKTLKRKCTELEKAAKKSESECNQLQEKFECPKAKKNKLCPRNVNKVIKRRDDKIAALKEQNEALQNLNQELGEKIPRIEELDTLKKEKLSLMKKRSKLELRIKKLHLQKECNISELKRTVVKQRKDIVELETMVQFLEGESVPKQISALKNGQYTHAVREACMTLLTECNLSFRSLPRAIDVILSKIGGISIDKLPSAGTLSQFMMEAGIITSAHVGAEMLKDFDPTSSSGNVFHQDATTKFHKHYEGMQVTLKEGKTLSMGLREVPGGSKDDYLQCFHNTLTDIAEAYDSDASTTAQTKSKLHASFKAFMNDKAAVNKALTTAIQDERKELLPTIVPNYDQLSAKECQSLDEMGHFSCRMHLLANLVGAAEKGISSYEDAVAEGCNPHAFSTEEQCGTVCLIQTCAKAFTRRGDDKSGVEQYFQSFLEGQGKENLLVPFFGHRFNILFYNAAAVFNHSGDIKLFLSSWPKPNRLLQTIKFDVKELVYLAGARALGIIFKLLTGPFQTLLSKNLSILAVNPYLQLVQQTLQKWAEDASDVLRGEPIGDGFPLNKDDLYNCLFSPSESMDSLTVLAVEQAAAEMLVLFERQAAEQLPGGELYEPTPEVKELASNVPCTNIISERDMAKLDVLIRAKPSANVAHLETCAMAQSNKPFHWLDSLDDTEKERRLKQARTTAPSRRRRIKERHAALKLELARRLSIKQAEKEQQETKLQANKLSLTKDIQSSGGLWEVQNIDQHVKDLSPAEAKKAIIKQLKFYRQVLGVKGPRHLFQESAAGEPYSLEKLQHNLHTVANSCNTSETSQTSQSEQNIIIKDIYLDNLRHRKQEVFAVLRASRKNRQAKGQQHHLLPELLKETEKLVGKEVLHKCQENGEIDWFRGTVIDIMKRTKDPMKTEFHIRYDSSTETWHFPLLMDMKNGDLIVL